MLCLSFPWALVFSRLRNQFSGWKDGPYPISTASDSAQIYGLTPIQVMNYINLHKFIYSHSEVSNRYSTLGYVRPFASPPPPPEFRGQGPQLSVQLVWISFKTELQAYHNPYCFWLFQATLDLLSFGTHTLRWFKGAMQISVIGHPLEVPISGLTGALHDRGGWVIRFQTARGPVAPQLRFDTSR